MSTTKARMRTCDCCHKSKRYKGFRKQLVDGSSKSICTDCQQELFPIHGEFAFVNTAEESSKLLFIGRYTDIIKSPLSSSSYLRHMSVLWSVDEHWFVEHPTINCTRAASSRLARDLRRELADVPESPFVYDVGTYDFPINCNKADNDRCDFTIHARTYVPGVCNFYYFDLQNSNLLSGLSLWHLCHSRWIPERILTVMLQEFNASYNSVVRLASISRSVLRNHIDVDFSRTR